MTQTLQIKRTETPDLAPTGLAPGELSVELANPVKLWVGVPTVLDPSGRKLLASPVIISDLPPPVPYHGQLWWESDSGHLFLHYVDANTAQWVSIGGAPSKPTPPVDAYSKIESDLRYVKLAGDTMTGHLFLNADPTAPMHAATKQYVDSASGSGITIGQGDVRYVLKAGDTMLGGLTIQMLHPNFVLDAAAGSTGNFITGKFTSIDRWSIRMPADVAGPGRFAIARFDDAGVDLGEPFIIDRQVGTVSAPNTWATLPKDVVTLDYLQSYTAPLVPGTFVLKAGDTMTGSLTINGEFLSLNRASNPAEGLAYFGNTMLAYLHFNGTTFSFTHAMSAPAITSWGTLAVSGGSTLTGLTNNGHLQNNGTLTSSGTITSNGELSAHGGIVRLNAAGTHYLWWDGTNFQTGIGYMWHSGNLNPAAYQPAGNYVPVAGGVIMTGILYHGSGSYYFNTDGTIVGGNISGATLASAGNLTAPGFCNLGGTQTLGITNNGHLQNNATGTFTGVLNCTTEMHAIVFASTDPSGAFTGPTGWGVRRGAAEAVIYQTFVNGYFWGFHESNNDLTLHAPLASGAACYWHGAGGKYQIFDSDAPKPGGGPWTDWSDARIKNVLGDYAHGLTEIMQLRPVRYTFRDNITKAVRVTPGGDRERDAEDKLIRAHANVVGREFIGLVAQEVEAVLPETITLEPATVDGLDVEDLRKFDPNALTYALINAVKELKAEIDALKAQLPARR